MNQRICTLLAVGASLALSATLSGQTPAVALGSQRPGFSQLAEDSSQTEAAYRLERSGAGTFAGKNAAQRLTLEFDPQEALLKNSSDSVGLHLTGYGYGRLLQTPLAAKLTGLGNRLEYQRGDLTEWYVNRTDGVEQGFTLKRRPGIAQKGEPLVIAMVVTEGPPPTLAAQGDAVLFQSSGNAGLRYGGLRSWDARGRDIPSRLEVRDREIRLIVDDRNAEYPLVVDPITATTFVPAPGSPDPVGVSPESVVVADFDKSGSQDLAVADMGGGFVSILLGQNNGTFIPQATTAGRAPRAMATGDFNGDTWPDLVVVNSNSGISVLLNSKNNPSPGSFQIPAFYPAGATPEAVAVGDFNNDLKSDLVVTNNGDNTISVLLGNGNGTFQTAVPYPVGVGPSGVVVGDFIESDPSLDLAVVNSGEGTVSILHGSATGAFTLAGTIVLGQFGRTLNDSQVIVTGDFNHDGHLDLAIAGDLQVVVLLGNGDGTFSLPAFYPADQLPSGIAIGDFNGDTIPDLAVTNAFSNDVSILIGNGDGTFKPAVNYRTGSFPTSVAVGDFNIDNRADLAITNSGDNDVTVLLGTLWNITALSGSPQATTVNNPFPLPLVAQVTDPTNANAPVPGALVNFTAPDPSAGASAILNPAGPQFTTAGGLAQVTATANGIVGSYLVTATLGFAGVATFTLTNNPGDPTVTASGGTPQTAALNTAFASSLQARVIDPSGKGVPGVPVTFTAPSGTNVASGTFPGGSTTASVNTNSSGVAIAPVFTANSTSGSYKVTATSPAAGVTGTGIFQLTNAGPPPAPPKAIVAAAGTPQSVGVNGQFSALIAKVTDASGNPVAGAAVTFTVGAGPSGATAAFTGGGTSATAQTDGTGQATSPTLLANSITGSYAVSASLAAFPAITPAAFSLTNLAASLLPASISMSAGATAMVPITLPSASSSTIIFTIANSASSIINVTTPSILVPAGSLTGRSPIRITGLKAGTATITACQSYNGVDCTATFGITPVSMLVVVH